MRHHMRTTLDAMRLASTTQALLFALTAASVLLGCTPASYPTQPATSPTASESTDAPGATPTLSAEIANLARSACPGGARISESIEPARIESVRFNDAVWHVEVVGLWKSEVYPSPRPPGYAPYATSPPWTGWYYIVGCTSEVQAETGRVSQVTLHLATVTPPAR